MKAQPTSGSSAAGLQLESSSRQALIPDTFVDNRASVKTVIGFRQQGVAE